MSTVEHELLGSVEASQPNGSDVKLSASKRADSVRTLNQQGGNRRTKTRVREIECGVKTPDRNQPTLIEITPASPPQTKVFSVTNHPRPKPLSSEPPKAAKLHANRRRAAISCTSFSAHAFYVTGLTEMLPFSECRTTAGSKTSKVSKANFSYLSPYCSLFVLSATEKLDPMEQDS